MPKPIVLVDMDGVLADIEAPNNDIIRMHFPDIKPIAERGDYYFEDTYRTFQGVSSKIHEENRRPGFFRDFPVISGALEGWQRILGAGYTPRICSSPIENHDTVVTEKREWLAMHFVPVFGEWVLETAIFDRDKSGYDAIALIDDRPAVRNAHQAVWEHILFDQSYNRAVATGLRLMGWYDPKLEDLLAIAHASSLHS